MLNIPNELKRSKVRSISDENDENLPLSGERKKVMEVETFPIKIFCDNIFLEMIQKWEQQHLLFLKE